MMAPTIEITVAMTAASTDGVHFNGNAQPEDRSYDVQWMDHFRNEARELGVELLSEIRSDFAMTVLFTKVIHSMVRVGAISAIRTDEGPILLINDIGGAPEKGVIDDRVLVWQGPHFPFAWEG
jgi:hypothetical protein